MIFENLCIFDWTNWTFNLPDFQDRVIQGNGTRGNVGTYKAESLPNITGLAYGGVTQRSLAWVGTGAFKGYKASGNNYTPSGSSANEYNNGFEFNASWSNSTYIDSAPVQQNALLIQCCIKY